MKLPDIVGLRNKLQQPTFISVSSHNSDDSSLVVHEDYALLSCRNISSNVIETPSFTASNVSWCIDLLRRHASYWRDKKLVAARIVRSVNLTLHKKNSESVNQPMLGEFGLLLFGERIVYGMSVGNIDIYTYKNKIAVKVLEGNDECLGKEKNAPNFNYYSNTFETNDVFILARGLLESSIVKECSAKSFNELSLQEKYNILIKKTAKKNKQTGLIIVECN